MNPVRIRPAIQSGYDDRKPAETVPDPDLARTTAAKHRATRRAAANGTPIAAFGDREVVWVRVDDKAQS